MGVVATVGYDHMPKQGWLFGARTDVCFNFDTSRILRGTIVRYDGEEPWVTIISLDNGRVVLGTECQYSPSKDGK